jgi:hypothetical protein
VLAIDGGLQKTLALRSGFYPAHKLPFVNSNLRAFFAVKQHFKDREAGEALAALGGAGEGRSARRNFSRLYKRLSKL